MQLLWDERAASALIVCSGAALIVCSGVRSMGMRENDVVVLLIEMIPFSKYSVILRWLSLYWIFDFHHVIMDSNEKIWKLNLASIGVKKSMEKLIPYATSTKVNFPQFGTISTEPFTMKVENFGSHPPGARGTVKKWWLVWVKLAKWAFTND